MATKGSTFALLLAVDDVAVDVNKELHCVQVY